MFLESMFMGRYTQHGKQFCNLCSRRGAMGDIMDPEAQLARFYMLIELNDKFFQEIAFCTSGGEVVYEEERNELKATFL